MRRNSPFTGWPSIVSAIFWDRSPSATALSTRPTSVVGRTRSSIKELIESTLVSQPPAAPGREARSVIRPSRPMILAIRTSSLVMRWFEATSSLYDAATSPITPFRRLESLTEKSPRRAASSASTSSFRASGSTARSAMVEPFGCEVVRRPRAFRAPLTVLAFAACMNSPQSACEKPGATLARSARGAPAFRPLAPATCASSVAWRRASGPAAGVALPGDRGRASRKAASGAQATRSAGKVTTADRPRHKRWKRTLGGLSRAFPLPQRPHRLAALLAARAVQDQDAVEVVHLVLDDPRLQPRGLHEPLVALLVPRAHPHVHRALHVHLDAGDRQAALLEGLAVLARPVDLGIRQDDHRGVGADAVDEQSLRDPQLGRGQADAEGVVHDPGHPLDLALERIVEAVHGCGARLQDGVAEPPDERHRRHPTGLDLGVELRALLFFAGPLGLDRLELVLLGH